MIWAHARRLRISMWFTFAALKLKKQNTHVRRVCDLPKLGGVSSMMVGCVHFLNFLTILIAI